MNFLTKPFRYRKCKVNIINCIIHTFVKWKMFSIALPETHAEKNTFWYGVNKQLSVWSSSITLNKMETCITMIVDFTKLWVRFPSISGCSVFNIMWFWLICCRFVIFFGFPPVIQLIVTIFLRYCQTFNIKYTFNTILIV